MDLWRTAVVGESADTRSCDAVSCASLMPVRCVSLQAVHPARSFDAVRLPYAMSASQGGERGRRGAMWVLNSGEDQCGGLVWAENGTAGFVTARALRRHRHDELVSAMSSVDAPMCPLCAFACEDTSADAYAHAGNSKHTRCRRQWQPTKEPCPSLPVPSPARSPTTHGAPSAPGAQCPLHLVGLLAQLTRCLVLVSSVVSVVCRATRDGSMV